MIVELRKGDHTDRLETRPKQPKETHLKLGVTLSFSHLTDVAFMAAAAKLLDERDLHSVWVPEHVLFFPAHASRYPYSDDGRIPGNPEGVLDPFTALTFIAAHTKRIRLGTGICLVPQRQPVYTAKMVADVDYLSNGRVDFGIGIGWLKEEFDALGMPFRSRARRCDEYIAAMQALWSEGLSSYQGETVAFRDCHFNPKPVQKPHPPIFIGGESDAALARVARIGDGWYGFDLDPTRLGERLQALDSALRAHGRRRADVAVYVCPNRNRITPESYPAYVDAGIDQLIAPVFARSVDDLERRVDRVLELAR